MQEAVKFLEHFRMTKIIIVLDTHSVNNGVFIWKGSSSDQKSLETCYMLEMSVQHVIDVMCLTSLQIISQCIPADIYKYISDKPAMEQWHQTLITNVMCGSSINHPMACGHLYEG